MKKNVGVFNEFILVLCLQLAFKVIFQESLFFSVFGTGIAITSSKIPINAPIRNCSFFIFLKCNLDALNGA